jgi:hypothetical protein
MTDCSAKSMSDHVSHAKMIGRVVLARSAALQDGHVNDLLMTYIGRRIPQFGQRWLKSFPIRGPRGKVA